MHANLFVVQTVLAASVLLSIVGTRNVMADDNAGLIDGWCRYPAHQRAPIAARLVGVLGVNESEPNDTPATAQVIPLGEGVGEDRNLDISGDLSAFSDVDYYRFSATKGDVLGLAALGAGSPDTVLSITDVSGIDIISNDDHGGVAQFYPPLSPLPGGNHGNDSVLAWIAPESDDYLIRLESFEAGSSGDYTIEVRSIDPGGRQRSAPDRHTIFLDFDGATVDAPTLFGSGNNPAHLTGLSWFISRWGLTGADEDAVIDSIVASFKENYDDLRLPALNGDRDSDTIDGHYAVEILNSRDHADPFGMPNVSRIIIGGTIPELGIPTIGIAEFIDPGNFGLEDTGVVLLDLLSAASPDPNSINSIPRGGGATIIDAIGVVVGGVAAHEAGHTVGNWHTNNGNATRSIMDSGGNLPTNIGGVGPDGIFGTADDEDVDFSVDVYSGAEGVAEGLEHTDVRTAFGLSTGTEVCSFGAVTTSLSEDFDDLASLAVDGWLMVNNSALLGSTSWFQGDSAVFAARDGGGNAYIAADRNNAGDGGGADAISNWLITPEVELVDGKALSFASRTIASSTTPDRLQVRMSTNGSSSDVGSTPTSVGDFTTLLLDINPELSIGGYRETWARFNAVVNGVGSPTMGRLAIRYFVSDAGPSGLNSNYIGIDSVAYGDFDCNGNLVLDSCDVIDCFGAACNDCNGNSVIDGCDILGCAGASSCGDCDENNTPDVCDIDFGAPDTNTNGIPDGCECLPSAPPVPETLALTGNPVSSKNRFASIRVDAALEQAIRVTHTGQPPPYDIWNGQQLFVGQPAQVCENSGQGLNTTPPDCAAAPGLAQRWFWAAPLGCDQANAHITDWTALAEFCSGSGEACTTDADCDQGTCGVDGVIHIHGVGIVPSKLQPGGGAFQIPSTYDIQVANAQCALDLDDSYSTVLIVTQAGLGDVVANVTQCPNGAPNLSVDVVGDVVGVLNKFANRDCAPQKTRTDLEPCEVDFRINITDVLQALAGFTGASFPFTPDGTTPCQGSCGL
jgi:hypothetical protein